MTLYSWLRVSSEDKKERDERKKRGRRMRKGQDEEADNIGGLK